MTLKKRKGVPGGGFGGGSRAPKSKKLQSAQAPDPSYTPRQKEVTTVRVAKSKRAAASKATKIIHDAADAILKKENIVSHHNGGAVSSLAALQEKHDSTIGRGLKLKLKNVNPTRDDSVSSHMSASSPKRSSIAILANASDTATFLDSISDDIGKIFYALVEEEDVQTELPDLYLPNLHANIDQDSEDDVPEIMNEWTPEKLFHLYLLAYSQNQPNICDLVADTWIREFQIAAPRIWKENKTEYGQEMKDKPLIDLGYTYLDNKKTTAFDPDRIQELYLHTRSSCGARFLWADAMALCGSKLENLLDTPGMGHHVWHHDLVWNIMRTSLRLTRARRTLKIEERDAESWCERYHEHGKWNKPCYRMLAAEQAKAKRDEEQRMMAKRQAKENSEMTAENYEMTAVKGELGMQNGHNQQTNGYIHRHANDEEGRIGEETNVRRVSFMDKDDDGIDEAMFMAAWDEDDSGDEM